jgi:hypothetical protein
LSFALTPTGILPPVYFDFGFRYFVAARFAAAGRVDPVAANLLHHAVAMFMLGGICGRMADDEREALDHDLNRIWNVFKRKLDPTNDLGRFDQLVALLHEFENVSRPKTMVRQLNSQLVFDEVEAFIKAICRSSGINKTDGSTFPQCPIEHVPADGRLTA